MKPNGNKKNKSPTAAVGWTVIRQTVDKIEVVKGGDWPVTVRLLEQCTNHPDSEQEARSTQS